MDEEYTIVKYKTTTETHIVHENVCAVEPVSIQNKILYRRNKKFTVYVDKNATFPWDGTGYKRQWSGTYMQNKFVRKIREGGEPEEHKWREANNFPTDPANKAGTHEMWVNIHIVDGPLTVDEYYYFDRKDRYGYKLFTSEYIGRNDKDEWYTTWGLQAEGNDFPIEVEMSLPQEYGWNIIQKQVCRAQPFAKQISRIILVCETKWR